MRNYIIAERYASALLELAGDNAENIYSDFKGIHSLIIEFPDLKRYLSAPTVDTEVKRRLIEQIFRNKIESDLYNFILLLLEKRRIDIIFDVIEAYEELYNEQMDIKKMTVITAVSLNKTQTLDLTAKLEDVSGKQVKLGFEVDQAIIGGLILKTKSRLLDGSVRRQLQDITYKLSEVKV